MNTLKPYMGYSRECGEDEGAYLIFAHNIREAKRIGYPVMFGDLVEDYIDMVVRLLKHKDFLFEQVDPWSRDKIAKDEAHIVDDPPCCKSCLTWGYPLNANGFCEDCEPEEVLR